MFNPRLKNRIQVFTLVLFMSSTVLAQSEVSLVADPWCPFTCDPNQDKPGLMIELVNLALGDKYKSKYQTMSWARALEDTRKGSYSAVVGALKSDAPDFVFPKTELATQRSCFYVLEESKWQFSGVQSLEGKTLGAVKDYAYGELLDSYIEKNKAKSDRLDFITGTETGLRLFLKLKSKRIDVLIEDETVASFIQKEKAELSTIKFKRAGCLDPAPLYAAFSPAISNSKQLAKDLDEGLKRLKVNGKWAEIRAKYGAH